jgi:hypothetical protein
MAWEHITSAKHTNVATRAEVTLVGEAHAHEAARGQENHRSATESSSPVDGGSRRAGVSEKTRPLEVFLRRKPGSAQHVRSGMLTDTVTRGLPIVVLGFVACSVYDADLLVGPVTGGAAGASGSGATSGGAAGGGGGNGGRASSAGSSSEAGAESDAGGGGGGSAGASGSSAGGEGGESTGGVAGSSGSGGSTSGGGGSTSGSGGNGGAGAGSGGASGAGAGSGGVGGVPGTIEELLIDDLEDGNHQIALMGQVGYWYSYNDGTGTQTPDPADPFAPVTVTPPIDGSSSTKAVHVRWQGFSSWGGGFGVVLTDTSTFYDASAYDGITFYARVESGSETRVDLIFAEERSLAPACTVCGHHPTYALTLTTSWQRFYLPFAVFQGDGGGDPSFVDLDPSRLYGIQFFRGANHTIDMWVDDLAFYRLQ